MATGLARKLWSIEEYERMIELGLLTEDDRVELIRGEIITMAAIGTRHAACVMRLEEIFHEMLGRTVTISVQNPIQLPNDSEPEPDVALLKRRDDHYQLQRPLPQDVLLLIEVSDSTLTSDRQEKVPLYAEAGIREVWLVNLDAEMIEVYSGPVMSVYSEKRHLSRLDDISLPVPLQASIRVDALLGSAKQAE